MQRDFIPARTYDKYRQAGMTALAAATVRRCNARGQQGKAETDGVQRDFHKTPQRPDTANHEPTGP